MRKTEEEKPSKPMRFCGFAGCGIESCAQLKVKTGWLDTCYDHYIDHHTAIAKEWNQAHGIHSAEDARKYLRSFHAGRNAGGLHKLVERTPGEDDE